MWYAMKRDTNYDDEIKYAARKGEFLCYYKNVADRWTKKMDMNKPLINESDYKLEDII